MARVSPYRYTCICLCPLWFLGGAIAMTRPSCTSSNRDPDESLSVELNPSSEDTVLANYILTRPAWFVVLVTMQWSVCSYHPHSDRLWPGGRLVLMPCGDCPRVTQLPIPPHSYTGEPDRLLRLYRQYSELVGPSPTKPAAPHRDADPDQHPPY